MTRWEIGEIKQNLKHRELHKTSHLVSSKVNLKGQSGSDKTGVEENVWISGRLYETRQSPGVSVHWTPRQTVNQLTTYKYKHHQRHIHTG